MPLQTSVRTQRLHLRAWRDDDVGPLSGVFAHPSVWHFPFARGWTGEETATFIKQQQTSWREDGFGVWAAELRSSSELIGFIGLSIPTFLPEVLPAVEVGWRLHPRHWGSGLATEGGREALRQGFDTLGLDSIISITEPDNARSISVMQRLGMRERKRTVHPARGISLVVYEAQASAKGSASGVTA